MKPLAWFPIACIALTLVGCSHLVRPNSSVAATPYDQVRFSMPREEVVALLGPPQEDNGMTCSWETRVDERNFSRLDVRFNKGGDVAWMQRTRKSSKTTVSSASDLRAEKSAARLNQSYLDAVNGLDTEAQRQRP